MSVFLSCPLSIYSSSKILAQCPGGSGLQGMRALTTFMFECEGQESACVMFKKQTCWPLTLTQAKIWWPRGKKHFKCTISMKHSFFCNPHNPFVLTRISKNINNPLAEVTCNCSQGESKLCGLIRTDTTYIILYKLSTELYLPFSTFPFSQRGDGRKLRDIWGWVMATESRAYSAKAF